MSEPRGRRAVSGVMSAVAGRYQAQDAVGKVAVALLFVAALKSVIWAIVARQVPDEVKYFLEILNIANTGRTDLISGHIVGVFAYSGAAACRLGGLLGIAPLLSVRLLGATCTTLVAWMGYRAGRVLSDGPFIPLATLILVAFNPMYSFMGSSANSDTMQIMWATALVLMAVQALVEGFSIKRVGLALVFAALVYLTKTPRFVLIVMVIAFVVLAAIAVRSKRLARLASSVSEGVGTPRGVAVLTLAVILGWALRTRFSAAFTESLDISVVRRLLPWFVSESQRYPSVAEMWAAFKPNAHMVAEHFWGYFGRLHVPGPPIFYAVQYAILAAAAAGLVVAVARRAGSVMRVGAGPADGATTTASPRTLGVRAAYAVLTLTVLGTLTAIVEYSTVTSSMMQGRYLLIFVVPLYLLVAACISAVVPRRFAGHALVVVFSVMVIANAWSLLYIIVPYFY